MKKTKAERKLNVLSQIKRREIVEKARNKRWTAELIKKHPSFFYSRFPTYEQTKLPDYEIVKGGYVEAVIDIEKNWPIKTIKTENFYCEQRDCINQCPHCRDIVKETREKNQLIREQQAQNASNKRN